jgi:hypothetical protein
VLNENVGAPDALTWSVRRGHGVHDLGDHHELIAFNRTDDQATRLGASALPHRGSDLDRRNQKPDVLRQVPLEHEAPRPSLLQLGDLARDLGLPGVADLLDERLNRCHLAWSTSLRGSILPERPRVDETNAERRGAKHPES